MIGVSNDYFINNSNDAHCYLVVIVQFKLHDSPDFIV